MFVSMRISTRLWQRSVIICSLIILGFFHTAFFDIKTGQTTAGDIKRIAQSVMIIQRDYYDPARIDPRKMMMEGFFELAKEVPEVLPRFPDKELIFQLGSKQLTLPLGPMAKLADILPVTAQAFAFLRENYKGEKKFEDMEYAFIAGMLAILDPHSNILPPKIYAEFKTQTQGEYGGLGIVIGIKEDELTVVAPIEGTPAFRAGIQPEDKIMQIGDQSTTNMPLTDAVDMMRGKVGTSVTLRIKSKNTEPRNVTLTRELIAIKSVQSKLVNEGGKKIGILKLKGFQDDTYMDMVDALYKLNQEAGVPLSGLVLDLRNNPGGLLDQAIKIADRFLAAGDIVYTVGAGNMDEEVAVANKQEQDVNLPLIVLINEGSASASEIVAGALRNNGRAVVMGTTSFGKGSVQTLFNLSDGSSLKLTVAQYLTPGKLSIQATGIPPDVHLYPSLITDEFTDLHEDEHYGEGKLDAHLIHQNLIQKTQPFFETTFLKLEKPKEDESDYVSTIKEGEDYPIQLAVKALATVTSSSKTEMLRQMQPLLEREKRSEESKIADVLIKRGVDWKLGQKQTGVPGYSVDVSLLDKTGRSTDMLRADSEAQIRVKLTNTSGTTLSRVLATIDSQNPLLNHKEFVIGKLDAGQTLESSVTLKLPADAISFSEETYLRVYSTADNETGKSFTFKTQIVEAPPPQFAYSYTVLDSNSSDVRGNGNGIPEPGEKIKLSVKLTNTGPGAAKKTSINIKNKEGDFVFLHQARATLGMIPSGGTLSGDLVFEIKPTYEKKNFVIDFFALDDESKIALTDSLEFNLSDPKTATPSPQVLHTAPSILLLTKSHQNQNIYKLMASVSDKTRIKDVAVFVKGRKSFYMNMETSGNTKSQDFAVDLPLVDGLNFILIQARGDHDLLAQKSLSVVYHDPALATAKTQ